MSLQTGLVLINKSQYKKSKKLYKSSNVMGSNHNMLGTMNMSSSKISAMHKSQTSIMVAKVQVSDKAIQAPTDKHNTSK